MSSLGQVTTGSLKRETDVWIPIDESVSGMMFDIGSLDNAFVGYSLARNNFGNGEVKIVRNLQEAESLGITQYGLLGGVPYYHIKQYYDYLKEDKELYISFPDINEEGFIENMMIESDCKVFQIGIWTAQPVLSKIDKDVQFAPLLSNINTELSIISGNENEPSQYPSGVTAVVCGGIESRENVSYRNLPNCKSLKYDKISLMLGEDSCENTATIHNNISPDAQIGMLGLFMACLTLAYAEENIGYVGKFNLNKDDIFTLPVLGVGNTKLQKINTFRLRELIDKGYIIPVMYEAKEGGVYFSGDSTMSDKTYNAISINRISHKFKRVVKKTLTPMINGHVFFDHDMNTVSSSDITTISNDLNDSINTYMVNRKGENQLLDYLVSISSYQPNLKDDRLDIEFTLALLDNQVTLNFIESFNTK